MCVCVWSVCGPQFEINFDAARFHYPNSNSDTDTDTATATDSSPDRLIMNGHKWPEL